MKELKKILDSIVLTETSESIPYSILPMMYNRISSKELLHSQIIASLLDPNKEHGLGERPLLLFLKKIGCSEFAKDLYKTKVEVEKGIDDKRRIDILLTNGNNAIIIENKLNDAVNQVNQLKDYLKSINKNYNTLKIVYLPLYTFKSSNEKVDAEVVNLYPKDLIKWLEECDNIICDNYIHLLKYINHSNKNFMDAKKILELPVEEIEKLTKIAAIINSSDWYTARFDPIKTGVKEIITDAIYSIKNYILSLWLGDYEYWVDVYARESYYDLYVVDYKIEDKENVPRKLKEMGYAYDSKVSEKRYFIKSKTYQLSSTDNKELIEEIVSLLKLSEK